VVKMNRMFGEGKSRKIVPTQKTYDKAYW